MEAEIRLLRLLAAGVILWTVAGWAGIAAFDPDDTRWLGGAWLAAIPLAALARSGGRWALGAVALAAVSYAIGQAGRAIGGAPGALPLLFGGALAFAGSSLLALALAQRLDRLVVLLRREREAIEDLRQRDDVTGAFRRRHVERRLVEEIERSRRYGRALTLVVIALADWPELTETRSEEAIREMLARCGAILGDVVRTVDTVAYHDPGVFSILLPETPFEGAEILAGKAATAIQDRLGLETRAGIADFPRDAVTPDELIQEAEAALAFAREHAVRSAGRSLLG